MKRIPALTLSGGKLSEFGGHKEAKEYRVWVHPHGGDDEFYFSKDYKEMNKIRKRLTNTGEYALVEEVIAVVYDKKFKRYREVVIDCQEVKLCK